MTFPMNTLEQRLADVKLRIRKAAERARRDPAEITLLAVTKVFPASVIRDAYTLGLRDFGENYVQEFEGKLPEVASLSEARFHLIGHLQTNKAKLAAELFDAVHSVDSERVARALAEHRPVDAQPIAALLEVDLTGLPGRAGVDEASLESLLRASAGLPGLHVLGLMTIPPAQHGAGAARPFFARLRSLRDRLEHASGWPLPELSMGMSDDFEAAVEEGATMIRVGRALFGERA